MTTLEIAPVIEQHEDEETHDDHDGKFCHLYVDAKVTMCGLPPSQDPHKKKHKHRIFWSPGQMSCPVCGMPVCVDCLLAAS